MATEDKHIPNKLLKREVHAFRTALPGNRKKKTSVPLRVMRRSRNVARTTGIMMNVVNGKRVRVCWTIMVRVIMQTQVQMVGDKHSSPERSRTAANHAPPRRASLD